MITVLGRCAAALLLGSCAHTPPPAPAAPEPIQETLTEQEVVAGVVAARPRLLECGLIEPNRTIAIRFAIQTSGRTSGAAAVAPALPTSTLAFCLRDVIGQIRYPRHRVAVPPYEFTFAFSPLQRGGAHGVEVAIEWRTSGEAE